MNREIKFRAWYKNKYHYNIEKHHVEHHSMSGFGGEVWDFSDWLKYAIVQQYTNLKDKNGEEIYEGDIISGEYYDTEYRHSENITCGVVFNNGSFNISHSNWFKPSLEIIGNIYEELIEQ